MSDAIKGGMYRGNNPGMKPVSLDRRIVKVKQDDGAIIEVPSVGYVRELEQQILELKKLIAILDDTTKHQDGIIKRLTAAIRKVDSKLQ